MIQYGILGLTYLPEGLNRGIRIVAERDQSFWSSLEMMVVGSGCSAFRAVVEECESVILTGKVQHVYVPVPDGLVSMSDCGYDQMVRKDRIRIHKNVVLFVLPAFELYHALLGRTVVTAKEASALLKRCPVQFRC